MFVQLPPDIPVFIKNNRSDSVKLQYKDRWYQFLKRAHDCSFLVSPRPKYTSDTILHSEKLKRLFEDNIIPCTSDFEVGSNAVYTHGSKLLTLNGQKA